MNPAIVVYAVNGLETSVVLFCIALVVLGFILMVQTDIRRDRDYVLLGAACGLLVLAGLMRRLSVPIALRVLWGSVSGESSAGAASWSRAARRRCY